MLPKILSKPKHRAIQASIEAPLLFFPPPWKIPDWILNPDPIINRYIFHYLVASRTSKARVFFSINFGVYSFIILFHKQGTDTF